MKDLLLFTIFCALLSSTPALARKSPIVDIEIANTMRDFYVQNRSIIHFKFTRADGSIDYTKGFKNGKVGWNRLHIVTYQATFYDTYLIVNYKALQKNDLKLDLVAHVRQGKNSFTKKITHIIPPITRIEIDQDSIVPYTWYPFKINLHTENKKYQIRENLRINLLTHNDFEWKLDSQLEQKGSTFRYVPSGKDTGKKTVNMHAKSIILGLQDLRQVPLQALQKKVLVYATTQAANGQNGENGYDGSTGENGGNGGGGWHASDGLDGKQVEILIAKHGRDKLNISVFCDTKIETYYLPINSRTTLTVPGGVGGNGGRGGNGGDGGSSSDEYDAGYAGDGGPGGNGGDGGVGGTVFVYSDLELPILSQIITIKTPGGLPGNGGHGGSGSPSGTGGKTGKPGKNGITTYQILSQEDMKIMIQELGL